VLGRPGSPTEGHHVVLPADPGGPLAGRPLAAGALIAIDGEAGHHQSPVQRLRVGEPVSLADGSGAVAQARTVAVARGRVEVEVLERFDVPQALPRVTVVQGLPKGRKLEEVVARLSEIGVDRLVPVVTARAVRQVAGPKADRVHARWQAIALAAAQQSRRARVLQVDPVGTWPVAGATGVVLYERAEEPLSAVLDRLLADGAAADRQAGDGGAVDEVVLAVGPEGGFELAEVEASGLRPAALGPTILRTETAGVVGAALILHHLGRLG
jgi:16S rRNA (uracil1498-N3)-methyltransferase